MIPNSNFGDINNQGLILVTDCTMVKIVEFNFREVSKEQQTILMWRSSLFWIKRGYVCV